MIRHSAILICLSCGLVILSWVVGCAGGSPTAEPTSTPVPTPTRQTQDDDSWHECLSGAMELWGEAEGDLREAQERSLDDLRGEDGGCLVPLQIFEEFFQAKKAMNACPLPSNPAMREADALFREAVSDHVWASDHFLLWCFAPPSEQQFHQETMMLYWSRGDSLWDEAMQLHISGVFAPTAEGGSVSLNCLRGIFITGTNDVKDTLDQGWASLGSGDSDAFCTSATAAQRQAITTAAALLECPARSDGALVEVRESCQDAIDQMSTAIDSMLTFCETGDNTSLDQALDQLEGYNTLYEECVDALESHPW